MKHKESKDIERQELNSSPLGGDKRGALNRINKLLNEKENILSIYFTAGYPQLNDTDSILQTLEEAGVDLVEIGMPFSDPLADGPTIQDSSLKALEIGMSL